MATLPCAQFEDAFDAVQQGRARLAMIPVDNSVAGRVADIHHLLPRSGLFDRRRTFRAGEPSPAGGARRRA